MKPYCYQQREMNYGNGATARQFSLRTKDVHIDIAIIDNGKKTSYYRIREGVLVLIPKEEFDKDLKTFQDFYDNDRTIFN